MSEPKGLSAVGHELAGPLQTALNALYVIRRGSVPPELQSSLRALEEAMATMRARLDKVLEAPPDEAPGEARAASAPKQAGWGEGKSLERRAIAEAVQGVLRHDARNKVGAIRNAAFFLRRKTEKTELWAEPRVAAFFSLIDVQLTELEGVLGDTQPAEAPAIRSCDVAACVRAALDGHSVAAPVLNLGEAVHAAVDAEALTLCVRALLDNALDFAGADSRVTITAERDAGSAVVRVADTGPGFPAARLSSPHTLLQSTRSDRAGLGLAVAWRLVRVAGGELALHNAEGGGAVATLKLPLSERAP